MPQGQNAPSVARLVARMVRAEVMLAAAEVALCGTPIFLWVRTHPTVGRRESALLPVAAAVAVVLALRLYDLMRPARLLLGAKIRQEAVSPADVELARRALVR